MRALRVLLTVLCACCCAWASSVAAALEKLTNTGSALMIAAHPDDENTALLSWLAQGRKVRTGYLSLTRGEGGQNLIGSEQGSLLGLIRTQELLAARRLDGAEQFFTRAVDFGFSKSPDEAIEKWGREQVLGDIVYVIRKFRPDVIILRFSGGPRDGHGQHQASALLGREAFKAAADPKRFPEQLSTLQTWRAKRVVWNAFAFTRAQEEEDRRNSRNAVEVDIGEYDALLGKSYSEVAAESRSQHRSQAMGSSPRRGSQKNLLVHVEGDPATTDVFDGVETKSTGPAADLLNRAVSAYDPRNPGTSVELLMKARPYIQDSARRRELDSVVAQCLGLWAAASVDRALSAAGTKVKLTAEIVNRSHTPVSVKSIRIAGQSIELNAPLPYNVPLSRQQEWTVPTERVRPAHVSDAEAPAYATALFQIGVGEGQIELERTVVYRFVDPVYGDRNRPFEVVPPVSARFTQSSILFATDTPQVVEIELRSHIASAAGTASLNVPSDWSVKPAGHPFKFQQPGERSVVRFEVRPPSVKASAEARVVFSSGVFSSNNGTPAVGIEEVDYPHIPPQVAFMPASASFRRSDVITLARKIGYIMGAGDLIPEALRQIGCEVTLLRAEDLASGDLSRFDAIVTGVRAYNTRTDLLANMPRLLDYVEGGGTLVVQYNVLDRGPELRALSSLGPYPIQLGRFRVSVEEAPMNVLKSAHPLLNNPNRITPEDFTDWVQERGLYFASKWDPKYETVVASNDPGEQPSAGGILYARYGKGAYVFTAYSWFRQLPAGVSGAYRLFANMLSAGKAR